jgi:hypothetical protein
MDKGKKIKHKKADEHSYKIPVPVVFQKKIPSEKK